MSQKDLTPQQLENRKAWVAALRSGDYEQAEGRLRRGAGDGSSYCCLGVLCDLQDSSEWERDDSGAWVYHNKRYGLLEPVWKHQYGMTEKQYSHAMSLNDEYGATFSQIADWIELGMPLKWEPPVSND